MQARQKITKSIMTSNFQLMSNLKGFKNSSLRRVIKFCDKSANLEDVDVGSALS
jgi:hypothetical protein